MVHTCAHSLARLTFAQNVHFVPFQLELSAFHSVHTIEQCTFTGARPLFDNRFFLIQVTGAEFIDRNSSQPIDKPVHAISKVFRPKCTLEYENHQFHMALIVRPREGCVPAQKVYIADAADPGLLPSAFQVAFFGNVSERIFQDGTNHVGEESSSRKSVSYQEMFLKMPFQCCGNFVL